MKRTLSLGVAVAAALLTAMLALPGCGSASEQLSSSSASSGSASESSSSSESASSEAVDLTFGEEAWEGGDMLLENSTGAVITGLTAAVEGDEPAALMVAGERWTAGETARVYLGSDGGAAYDVELTVAGASYVLHGVVPSEIVEASVCLDGDVAYLAYEKDGSAVSTLQDETAIAAQAAEDAAAVEAEPEVEYTYDDAAAASEPAQSEDSCVDGGVVLR